MKIYTKTGDDGTTGLYGGGRVSKASVVMQAIGDVDELNCCLGLCRAAGTPGELDELLQRIQSWLFDLGAMLATSSESRHTTAGLPDSASAALENSIDRMSGELEPLRNFILPGGSPSAAHLHHARAVCRRAERSVLRLAEQQHVEASLCVFLNRLSDWLFVAARTANARQGVSDMAWQKSEDF